jgi:hypothetical protein
MSSQSLSQPHPGRRYGWWIAGGIAAAILALGCTAVVLLAGPAKFVYGLASGNPSFPGCETAAVRDATAGPLWYRVVDLSCPDGAMHFVYARRGDGPGLFVLPALMSAVSPIPVSVRQTGENAFEVVLARPLADGQSTVPFELYENGLVKETQFFDHGHKN